MVVMRTSPFSRNAAVFFCIFWVHILSCSNPDKPISQLHNSHQILLVIADNDTTHAGELFGFNRFGRNWQKVFSFPVAIGRNGLGWGIGLHDSTDRDPSESVKREGDGKSPIGIFGIKQSYGYLPQEVVDTRLPYEKSGPELICIDDAESEYYNMVVNSGEKGFGEGNLPSHEEMVRRDDLYKFTIFVEHNRASERGAGSCIFLHLWHSEGSSTAGCTAMAEPEMVKLLAWLDPEKNPVLVQLTRKSFVRLRERWELPEVP